VFRSKAARRSSIAHSVERPKLGTNLAYMQRYAVILKKWMYSIAQMLFERMKVGAVQCSAVQSGAV
jgi:hypothetical protein